LGFKDAVLSASVGNYSHKGVYWNANYKVYMALRHANVQAQVEKILDVAPFFPKDDYYKMKVSLQVNLLYLNHILKILNGWKSTCLLTSSCEKEDKTFSMARFSTIKIAICFLQHPVFMKQWLCNLSHIKCC
jgi:hypothetical protein